MNFTKAHKKELEKRDAAFSKSPVVFTHGQYTRNLQFKGLKGACYPLVDAGVHLDFLEMDNPDYFDALSDSSRIRLAEYFNDRLPPNLKEQYQADHSSVGRFYVAVGFRNLDNSYEIRRAVQIDPLRR